MVKTLLLRCWALRKVHVIDGQNTCDQITSDQGTFWVIKSCSVHSILCKWKSGSSDKCRLHTWDACVITTWSLGTGNIMIYYNKPYTLSRGSLLWLKCLTVNYHVSLETMGYTIILLLKCELIIYTVLYNKPHSISMLTMFCFYFAHLLTLHVHSFNYWKNNKKNPQNYFNSFVSIGIYNNSQHNSYFSPLLKLPCPRTITTGKCFPLKFFKLT